MTGLRERLRANARRFRPGREFDAGRELEDCARLGLRLLTRDCPEYPALLAQIADPPEVLYVRGEPPASAAAVAVVGSRRPTPYGRRTAARFGAECARAGTALVSGLARGVDAEAHAACARAGGRTWAVLGSGLDRVYPAENAPLGAEIVAAGGCLLSEVPLAGPPAAENFPRRNRIVAGLAPATVVVEGDLRSGALITAREALAQGREVFAVPGPVDSALSDGPNELLFHGAPPARSLADVLRLAPAVNAFPEDRRDGGPAGLDAAPAALTSEGKKILELLRAHELGVEELLSETGMEPAGLLELLSALEMRDLIRPIPGQRYARN